MTWKVGVGADSRGIPSGIKSGRLTRTAKPESLQDWKLQSVLEWEISHWLWRGFSISLSRDLQLHLKWVFHLWEQPDNLIRLKKHKGKHWNSINKKCILMMSYCLMEINGNSNETAYLLCQRLEQNMSWEWRENRYISTAKALSRTSQLVRSLLQNSIFTLYNVNEFMKLNCKVLKYDFM